MSGASPVGGGPLAVLLINLGGPDSAEAVRPYVQRLFADPEMIRLPLGPRGRRAFAALVARLRAPSSRRKYAQIGGASPLGRITEEQAAALDAELSRRGLEASVLVGMRYSEPSIADAVRRAAEAGASQLLALPLYPQHSVVTSGSSALELERARAELAPGLPLEVVRGYHDHPGYVAAVRGTVERALDELKAEERREAVVLFSAHSIPERTAASGDPYPDEVRRSAELVAAGLPGVDWRLGFQSRVGPVRWVGPETAELVDELGREGCRALVAVPLGFVSDHLETLYDLDIVLAERAARAGIGSFRRAPSLNCEPGFIAALADLVERAVPGCGSVLEADG